MAEVQEVAKRKITIKNTAKANRVVFDASGKQHLIAPGDEAEVELAEPAAVAEEAAAAKAAEPLPPNKGAPEIPEEQKSRSALAEAEAALMEEGHEADKERRETDAKKSGPQLAAETGIHMHARGETPHVVTRPSDAPPKKKS
jgi:hypothetical protein